MKRILVTGGTTFVSKYTASYFVQKGYEVYVLNRGSKPQVSGVNFLKGDRHNPIQLPDGLHFDSVIDITAYKGTDVKDLLKSITSFETYILLSSSAVYPETENQPFSEECERRENVFWKQYGTDKIDAENTALKTVPDAYILRPPYLYGPMNNVYREAFVFDCAKENRPFYLPRGGEMKLQFFYVKDLCRIMEKIVEEKPCEHILNVGNPESITVKDWVKLCYECAGKKPDFINVREQIEQRNYFPFYDYEYALDVSKQKVLLSEVTGLREGLKECFEWYCKNEGDVKKKPLLQFIDEKFGE